MEAFYQLVSSSGNYDETIRKSSERNLYPSEIKTKHFGNFLALKFTPENLINFDSSTKDLNVRYILFSNIDLKRVIKNAECLHLSIRDINGKCIDEYKEEIDKYLLSKNYEGLLSFINENKLMIKKLDLFLNHKNIIKFYDSGIVWTDTELSNSTNVTELVKSVLELTVP